MENILKAVYPDASVTRFLLPILNEIMLKNAGKTDRYQMIVLSVLSTFYAESFRSIKPNEVNEMPQWPSTGPWRLPFKTS